MCYRCRICDDVVPHGTPLLKHATYRMTSNLFGNPQRQIAQEYPVCSDCKSDLNLGMDPREMQLKFQRLNHPEQTVVVAAAAQQLEEVKAAVCKQVLLSRGKVIAKFPSK